MSKKISEILHPSITEQMRAEWKLWRVTLEGGSVYIKQMLQKYSKAEDRTDFEDRMKQTYNPARAKSAVFEVRNAIFQRLADVIRDGGDDTYQQSMKGLLGGVDLLDNSMMTFLGDAVLPDLLGMEQIFVMVDMPVVADDATAADTKGLRPYLYTYKREDVLSWVPDLSSSPGMFSKILVRHTEEEVDDKFGLPTATVTVYRLMSRVPEGVLIEDYDKDDKLVGTHTLDIDEIPVVKASIYDSLLKEIAHHQLAMLQMASADVTALVKGNFSLYVEQFDPAYDDDVRGPANITGIGNAPGGEQYPEPVDRVTEIVNDGVYSARNKQGADGRSTMASGPSQGRGYVKGTERPSFINPSQEPALASMAKQKELADEIKVLIDLALTGLGASYAAAESKRLDQGGLEAGLSYIGLQLHVLEQSIARIWQKYVDKSKDGAKVVYPKNYNIKSDSERRDEASDLQKLQGAVPSNTYQKAIAKDVVHILLGDKLPIEVLKVINGEIEAAKGLTADPDVIAQDLEAGVVSVATASGLRGYDANEAEMAKADHADRAARIAMAQQTAREGAARGAGDMSANPNDSKGEKEGGADPTTDPAAVTGAPKQRGVGA
jgi:hypothetical protein